MKDFKYRLVKFGGDWLLYEKHISSTWEILLFTARERDQVIKYMDADARGDDRTCYALKHAAALMRRGF